MGDALPGAFLDRLVELAAGNPLFVEQVLHMLIDEGRLEPGDAGWRTTGEADPIEVPPTIEAILAARIDKLGGTERACAEAASVIGMEFWAEPLGELAGEGAARALARLRRKLVIETRRPGGRDDMLRFRHLLLRDAVYEAIPKARRALLHERVADWLGHWSADRLGEVEELLGYHYEAAARYSSELLVPGTDRAPARAGDRAPDARRQARRRAPGRRARCEVLRARGRSARRAGPDRLEPL